MLKNGFEKNRDDIILKLNKKGVGTSVHYPVCLPNSKYYKEKYVMETSDYPNAIKISSSTISLPCAPHVSEEEANFIGNTVNLIFS